MKIRHIENGDIDYCSSLFKIKREQLFDRLLHPKGRFNDTLYYVAYDEATGKNEGAFVFYNIDYKNRHLGIIARPRNKEILDIAVRYAFFQFDLNKVYFFSTIRLDAFVEEGVLREKDADTRVYSIIK
ncbi:MAG: hypothetical protein AABZ57_00370 [Candidatus Margulisiibacteriota bacterium]